MVQLDSKIVIDSIEWSKILVLHVDDDAGFLNVCKLCLERHGPFIVDTASSVARVHKIREIESEDDRNN
jgi:DNA-binding NtrC family response regulator